MPGIREESSRRLGATKTARLAQESAKGPKNVNHGWTRMEPDEFNHETFGRSDAVGMGSARGPPKTRSTIFNAPFGEE